MEATDSCTTHHDLAGFASQFYRWIIRTLSFRASGYRRLRSQNSRKKRVRILRLGNHKRRSFKLRRIPKLHFRWISPFSLLAKLRDAYVNLLVAASAKMSYTDALAMSNFAGLSGTMRPSFGEIAPKEYETRILVELYKSVAQNQLIVSGNI